jgi:hypothetical protein
LLATSDVPKDALFYQRFRRKCNIDKRGHLQRFIQGSGIQCKKISIERQRNSLKSYKLKHSYYNMTEQGSRHYKHDTIVAWHEDVLSSQLL